MPEVYTPDSFVIMELNFDDITPNNLKLYKILAGWSGGYLNGSSWRINSGIEYTTFDGEKISVYGASGSRYDVYMRRYALRAATAPTWAQIKEIYKDKAQLLSENEAFAYLGRIARKAENGQA